MTCEKGNMFRGDTVGSYHEIAFVLTILVIDEPTMGADQGNGRALGEIEQAALALPSLRQLPPGIRLGALPSTEPRPTSRLCCQIRVTAEIDGITVHLPEEQA